MSKKKLFLLITVIIALLTVTIIVCYNKNVSYTKFNNISDNGGDIKFLYPYGDGYIEDQANKEILINFINSIEVVEKNVKFPNESADVYIKIYDKRTLTNDIRFYGENMIYDHLANRRYVANREIRSELIELLKRTRAEE